MQLKTSDDVASRGTQKSPLHSLTPSPVRCSIESDFRRPLYSMPRLNIRNLIDRLTDVLAEITEAWAECVNVEIADRLDRQRIMIERIIQTLESLLE